jgi:hypothetical protein
LLRAVVLSPHGRDAAVAQLLITQTGIGCLVCRDLPELVAALDGDAAFALLTEEAVRNADLKQLAPGSPSNLPGPTCRSSSSPTMAAARERNPIAGRWLEALGNVTFIERPFHPMNPSTALRAPPVKSRRGSMKRACCCRICMKARLAAAEINDQLERRVRRAHRPSSSTRTTRAGGADRPGRAHPGAASPHAEDGVDRPAHRWRPRTTSTTC